MENLSFDSGIREISINNDPSRVIRFNPGDPNQFKAIKEIFIKIQSLGPEFERQSTVFNSFDGDDIEKIDQGLELIEGADSSIREIIDAAFAQPICDTVFGTQNICTISNEQPIWQNFIDALASMCAEEMQKTSAVIKQNTAKYIDKYSSPTTPVEQTSSTLENPTS